MLIQWGSVRRPKYIGIGYGEGWKIGDFKIIGFRKTPLGWDMNIWRWFISYDNYEKVKK